MKQHWKERGQSQRKPCIHRHPLICPIWWQVEAPIFGSLNVGKTWILSRVFGVKKNPKKKSLYGCFQKLGEKMEKPPKKNHIGI